MSATRRFKRGNVDPFTGSKDRKCNNKRMQLFVLSGSLRNLCNLYITKTIAHWK